MWNLTTVFFFYYAVNVFLLQSCTFKGGWSHSTLSPLLWSMSVLKMCVAALCYPLKKYSECCVVWSWTILWRPVWLNEQFSIFGDSNRLTWLCQMFWVRCQYTQRYFCDRRGPTAGHTPLGEEDRNTPSLMKCDGECRSGPMTMIIIVITIIMILTLSLPRSVDVHHRSVDVHHRSQAEEDQAKCSRTKNKTISWSYFFFFKTNKNG